MSTESSPSTDGAAQPAATPITAPPQPQDAGLMERVRGEELDIVMGRPQTPPAAARADQPDDEAAWGLALSGGGIRSATFGLGVLQALARKELLRGFHYQSTVSGGGYIGAFVQGLLHRRGLDGTLDVLKSSVTDAPPKHESAADPQRPIRHLREYSNYLSPRKSALSGDTMGMIGTYVRNVLLIQVQLLAVLVAACLLPLVLYWAIVPLCEHPYVALLSTGVLCLAAGMLIGNVTSYAAPVVGKAGKPWLSVTARALAVIVLLGLATLTGAMGLACLPPDSAGAWLLPFLTPSQRVAVIAALLYFVVWLAWLAYDRRVAQKQRVDSNGHEPDPRLFSPMQQHRGRFVAAAAGSAIVAALTLLLAHRLLKSLGDPDNGVGHWYLILIGPTVVLTSIMLAGIAHVGFAGPALSDLQREIWARIGGRAARAVILVSVAIALTVYGPWLLRWCFAVEWAAVAASLSWFATIGAGVVGAFSRRSSGRGGSPLLEIIVRIAPAVFVVGLLMAVSLVAQVLLQHAGFADFLIGAGHWNAPGDVASSAQYLAYLVDGVTGTRGTGDIGSVSVILVTAALVAIAFGSAIDVNEFSMNAFYRNRLVRCYLGASNAQRQPEATTNFDPRDDIGLDEVVNDPRDPRPDTSPPTDTAAERRVPRRRPLYPLIGTALNLTATRQLDWQDRKAASFCLTPRYCGYVPPSSRREAAPIGDRPPSDPEARREKTLAQAIGLGTAVSISGAAVSPNMGYHSSPAVTFLLTVFDARLGWWLPNPHHESRPRVDKTPSSLMRMLYEMLGLTRDDDSFVYLSDGGHFENLGLYELVRRRCRFIVCVDAGADRARNFADLGNAVQKCRVDFGANILIDVSALRPGPDGRSERCCAVGTIEYRNGQIGTLLYLKPSLTGAEHADVAHYASAHPSFPHESTADQYFDEKQFESYRRLGEHVANTAIDSALDRALQAEQRRTPAFNSQSLSVDVSSAKENFLAELAHQWVSPLEGVRDTFSTHGKAMGRLLETMRATPALAALDAQVYPAWTDLVPDDGALDGPELRRTRLPRNGDFRACFYFCQEVMQLMESVYHDLQLEQFWNHPDNRGWMNLFRYWSWSPMFRIAWGMSSPTYGTRFVTFCETRLGLPALPDLVEVREASPSGGQTWAEFCGALAGVGAINHVERDVLTSPALGIAGRGEGARLFVLQLQWSKLLVGDAAMSSSTTFGIAVLNAADGGDELRLLRIQDHLRRLGLGTEFMRQLVQRRMADGCAITRVDVPDGSYGLGGLCTESASAELNKRLQQLLNQAQQSQRAQAKDALKA